MYNKEKHKIDPQRIMIRKRLRELEYDYTILHECDEECQPQMRKQHIYAHWPRENKAKQGQNTVNTTSI